MIIRVANDCSLYAEIKVGDKVALNITSLDLGVMMRDTDICCECSKIEECKPDLMQGATIACLKYWPKCLSFKWLFKWIVRRV